MVESFPTPVKTSHLTLPAFRFLGRLQQSGRLLKVGDETNEVCVKTSPIPSLVSCFQRAVDFVSQTACSLIFKQALERYEVPSLVSCFRRAVDFVSQTACSLIFKQALERYAVPF